MMPAGPVTDRSRMLPPPPGSVAQPVPRFEIPPPLSPTASTTTMPPGGGYGIGLPDRGRTRSRSMVAIAALIALVAGFPLLFFTLPEEIVKLWPQSASLYEWLGQPVNARGFNIVATYSQETNEGIPAIVVKGRIINETDRELPVPAIRLAIRDAQKTELRVYKVLADQDRLGPKQEGTFQMRLDLPPAPAADVEIRLYKDGE
jgi:hypothetical protein